MQRTTRIAALALPLALALTFGAGTAAFAIAPQETPPNADVPWFPFEQPEEDPDGPAADVPWFPFDEGGPDNPDDDIDPDPGDAEPEPEPEVEPEPLPEPAPETIEQADPVDTPQVSPKDAVRTDETSAADHRGSGDLGLMLGTIGFVLAGLALAAGIVVLVLWRSAPRRN